MLSGRQAARTRTRTLAVAVVLAVVLLGAAGCGGDSSSGGQVGSTQQTKVIDVTIKGDSVTPNGERVSVGVGQPITLDVTADTAGEIHVHSTPEQELEYDAGTTKISMTPIKTPGIVEVESHALDKTIVQLEVK